MQKNPLTEISEHVLEEAKNQRVAAIFDLDSTLFCVSPRIQHILRTLGSSEEFSQAYKEEAEVLRNIEVLPTDWGIKTVIQRTGISATPDLVHRIRSYWRAQFFSNYHLDKDIIYPAADEYVRHLHSLGARILYLTGRSESLMREGTLKALKKWNFPLDQESDLYMKPIHIEKDEAFKAHVLKDLVHQFDHIWFFENEPVIIEQVQSLVPKIHIVFVNSTHSGKAQEPQNLRTVGMSYRDGLPQK